MILSFHPCFAGDHNIICAGREPGADDLAAIKKAKAVIVPQGCRESFDELVERYGISLFRFLRYKTNNLQDAEDLVQEAFVRAYENIQRYRSSWKFSTWLFTIATRLAYSHFRRSRSVQTVGRIESSAPEPGQMVVEKETRQGLWALARGLSIFQPEYLVLIH